MNTNGCLSVQKPKFWSIFLDDQGLLPGPLALLFQRSRLRHLAEVKADDVMSNRRTARQTRDFEAAPDDTDINSLIDGAESLREALFDIANKYGAAVTNNHPHWEDGVYVREISEFIEDIETAVVKHTGRPLN